MNDPQEGISDADWIGCDTGELVEPTALASCSADNLEDCDPFWEYILKCAADGVGASLMPEDVKALAAEYIRRVYPQNSSFNELSSRVSEKHEPSP